MWDRLTDAETLIGYALFNPESCPKIRDDLLPNSDEKSVLRAIQSRWRANKDISLQSIVEDSEMQASKLAKIYELSQTITPARYQEVLERRKKEWKEETLKETIYRETKQMVDEGKSPSDTINALTEAYHSINISTQKYKLKTVDELVKDWDVHYHAPATDYLKTGIGGIDEAIGGLRGTELVLVLADTGMGKTNLLLNMAMNMCAMGKSVTFYSLEMGANELLDRLIPIVGNLDASQVRERTISDHDLRPILERIQSFDFRVVDTGTVTSQEIADEIVNSHHSGNKSDVVMVDYLQRLSDGRGDVNEVERLGNIARLLKNTALTYHTPIITPVQVDKSSSKGGAIRVENVAWSKDIANEADLALYLYQEEPNSESLAEILPPDTYVKIVKSRHSARGQKIQLLFSTHSLRMQDISGGDINLMTYGNTSSNSSKIELSIQK